MSTRSPTKKRLKFAVPGQVEQPGVNWGKCCLCRGDGKGPLRCPADNPILSMRYAGYKSVAALLLEFDEGGFLPAWIDLRSLDDGSGLAESMQKNELSGMSAAH